MRLEKTVENVYLRQDAAALIRKYFWPLLGIAVIQQLLTSAAKALISSLTGGQVPWLLSLPLLLLTTLLEQTLYMGAMAEYVRMGRGNAPRVVGVFSRVRYCLKALGLHLLTMLKIGLWLLPGLVLIFADTMIMQGAGNAFTLSLGIGLLFGLGIPAMLRYEMALPLLADEPHRTIRECITLSKGLMEGRKVQYAKLIGLPLAVMAIILAVVNSVLNTLLAPAMVNDPAVAAVITSIALWLAGLYWSLQLKLLPVLFYLKRYRPVRNTNETKENPHEQPDR